MTMNRDKDLNDLLEHSDLVSQAIVFENDPANVILVPEAVGKYHPLVCRTVNEIKRNKNDRYNRCYPNRSHSINLICSKASLNRAGRILHALMAALDKRQLEVVIKDYKTLVYYGHIPLEISMMEKVHKIKDKEFSYTKHGIDPDYKETGLFELKIDTFGWSCITRVFTDRKRKTLDQQLNEFMISLAKTAFSNKVRDFIRKEQHRQWDLEQQYWQKEQFLRQDLDEKLALWHKARLIRDFLDNVQTSPTCISVEGLNKADWLTWGYTYADRIDPTKQPIRQ